MKDRGKAVDTSNGEFSSSMMPCRKHLASSSSSSSSTSSSSGGGICAFCLRERLSELICPECGEQRFSSCSCSESSADLPRMSFLLENDKPDLPKNHPKTGEPEILKRSNSSCVNNRGVFWKFGKLFRKRRQKNGEDDSNSEMYVSDLVGIPRSRSLCSFRGGGSNPLFYDTEGSSGVTHSAARVSSVSGGFMMDSAKRSCFSESEARISNFEYEKDLIAKGIFTMKEGCEFSGSEDNKFMDLKLDLSSSTSEIRTEHPVLRKGGLLGTKEFGYGSLRSKEYNGMCNSGDLKKCRKSRKVWRWFFRASSRLGQN